MPEPGQEPKHPSSEGQLQLGKMIKGELRPHGLELHEFKDGSFLFHLPATPGFERAPHVVFAAHLDTYYGVPGLAKPKVHTYTGGDLVVCAEPKVVIPAADLEGLEGCEIITASGDSLLGADDKAGAAALVEVIWRLAESRTPHGALSFWFCVDEEIGELDIGVVPEDMVRSWNILWTVDGERLGPIDVGCFYYRQVDVVFKGVNSHPGVGGHKLRPAQYAAVTFAGSMANLLTPMESRELEPAYYVAEIKGDASRATVRCDPRSFDGTYSDYMVRVITELAQSAARRHGVTVEIKDRMMCHNTRPCIEAHKPMLQPGIEAHEEWGFKVTLEDVRGGTDGAMVNMTYPDLPAPNMGAGGKSLHGPEELLVVRELEALPGVMLSMVARYRGMPV